MIRVLLESPYGSRDPVEVATNLTYARACVRDSVMRGEAPIASHLLFTQPCILNDDDLTERALGIDAGLAWIVVADKMVVYTDRGISGGMKMAMRVAESSGLEIELRELSA